MRFHEFSSPLFESTDKPKARTFNQFSVEANLVIVADGGTIWAYNGSPRAGGKKIGGAMVMGGGPDEGKRFHIYKSSVEEKYRKKGVARAMYDAVEAYCESKGGYLVPSNALSDDAFAFWSKWKPHRIAYDGRNFQQHYLGKVVQYDNREWTIYHCAGHGYGGFGARLVGGENTCRLPRQLVIDQLGDFFPKTPAPYPPPQHPVSTSAA
jgi:GNAT superfamily N-acetyltransferase